MSEVKLVKGHVDGRSFSLSLSDVVGMLEERGVVDPAGVSECLGRFVGGIVNQRWSDSVCVASVGDGGCVAGEDVRRGDEIKRGDCGGSASGEVGGARRVCFVGRCDGEACAGSSCKYATGVVGSNTCQFGESDSGEVDERVKGKVRGRWYDHNKKKKERRKLGGQSWRSASWCKRDEVVSEGSDAGGKTDEQLARETLHKTWILKNELEAARLQRELEVAKCVDVEAEVKRRQSAVRKQIEKNLAETERHHRFLVNTGNVPGEGRPSNVKVVNGRRVREVVVDGEVKYEEEGVSGGGYVEGTVLESCTIQPSSSASMKEYMAEKKRAEDEEKRRKDAEERVKVLERQLASAGIGVKRDEVGNTEYSFSNGGDVTYRGKLQAAYRGKVVRVVKDSYGVPAVENVMAGAFGDGSETLSDVCIREVERYEEVRRSQSL